MTDNELLQLISDDLAAIRSEGFGEYSSILTQSATVDDTTPTTRAANPAAIRTAVINEGPGTARVSEGGALVKILDVYESWISPEQGRLAITAVASADETAKVTISTYI